MRRASANEGILAPQALSEPPRVASVKRSKHHARSSRTGSASPEAHSTAAYPFCEEEEPAEPGVEALEGGIHFFAVGSHGELDLGSAQLVGVFAVTAAG